MNVGLRVARGDVVVRVDGNAALAADYLRVGVAALDASGTDCVGGVLDNQGDTYVGRAIAAAMSSPFGVGSAKFRTGGGGAVDTVAFGAYQRRVFSIIGGYREDIEAGEDDEFNYRLRDAGGVILLVPEMRATYTVRGSLRGLWRQYFAYGRAKPEVLRLHPRQAQARQFAPPALVAALASTGTLAALGRSSGMRLVVLVYAVAAGVASLAAAMQRGVRILPLLPAVFACMHVAYGAGMIAGALDALRQMLPGGRRTGTAATGREAPRRTD